MDFVMAAPLNHAIRILVVMLDAGATKKEFQTALVFRNSLTGRVAFFFCNPIFNQSEPNRSFEDVGGRNLPKAALQLRISISRDNNS